MSLKSKLQIYIVTYNRKNYLQRTFEAIFAETSPIRGFDITVLDNASDDGSSELIDEYCQKFPNIKHIRHSLNIGGNANICRAFELGASCGKDYFWVLCDDDLYDFSNWAEVESNIFAGKDIVCLCDYICNTEKKKLDPAFIIPQLTFVPAGIYKSSLIDSNVLMNMYDSILTMFQQSVLAIKCINEHKEIVVLSTPIVLNGLHYMENCDEDFASYTRGMSNDWVLERRENTTWILGYIQVLSLLKDKNVKTNALEAGILFKDIFGSWRMFYFLTCFNYFRPGKFHYFLEIFGCLSVFRQIFFVLYFPFYLLSLLVFVYHTPKGIYLRLFNKIKLKLIPFKKHS